jgi:DMSO reductase anchor subunit
MHPAFSVVFFTTATGAGYGLLALLGMLGALGFVQPDFWLGFTGMALALGLITAGLLSSTGHLGRPERAWRAFSQWRSSWLSREGVLSVATYVPAGLFGIGWMLLGRIDGWIAAAGLIAACGAVATVCATGMIYASLKPIAQWHSPYTLPGYLIFSAMSGLLLLNALLQGFGLGSRIGLALALLATLVGWGWKLATWRHNDRLEIPSTANTATGLAGGTVRSLEWPHTEENYVLKEMGFRIARKHAAKLRRITQGLAFLLPALLLAAAFALSPPLAAILSVLAAIAQLSGLLVERWLFFAEAKHTVTLYYGR